jgi:hypothetical protein
MIKVVAPTMACQVIDWAMQAHGGGGMCDDFPLAYAYAQARTLRFADGPDEVHRNAIAKWELGKYGQATQRRQTCPQRRSQMATLLLAPALWCASWCAGSKEPATTRACPLRW